MGIRGVRPKRNKEIIWSQETAYAVGLMVTDGCLYKDGRHIDLTSKDVEQLNNFKKCLNLNTKISYKLSGYTKEPTPRLQFSDVTLYKFFLESGLTPAKTKTIGKVNVPNKYFFDFLRGHHDGDGCFYSYKDKRWPSSFMFYLSFVSASKRHLIWLQSKLQTLVGVSGHICIRPENRIFDLRYAKRESLIILKKMYFSKDIICLKRKRLKIESTLRIVGESL
ncbi:MAG TPA: hypothetical protein PKA42_03830 [Candidatus Paceibacterota bacterium]|nr:hypothetical protein [Candidatus Paceibacterota bacterium]HMO83267.1 hypothetical protein [Candidatus Paceibacterota bacterium]